MVLNPEKMPKKFLEAVEIHPISKGLSMATNLFITGTDLLFEGCSLCDGYPSRCVQESIHSSHF